MGGIEDQYLHLGCAQELNNSAAMFLEEGKYEPAISSLHFGLKLLIATNHHGGSCCASCSCRGERDPLWNSLDCDHPCTLDSCIAFSEQTSFLIHNTNCGSISSPERKYKSQGIDSICSHKSPPKKRRLSHSRDEANGLPTTTLGSRESTPINGYVYMRPIRVPFEGFSHCYKGYTSLLVVIVFNLAIAHHLNAIQGSSDTKTDSIDFLYRLCLHMLHQISSISSSRPPSTFLSSPSSPPLASSSASPSPSPLPSPLPLPLPLPIPSPPSRLPTPSGTTISSAKTSIRCEMIIHNNLSQLYHMSGNHSNHKKSLHDLLSTYMVLVERGTRESTGSTSDISNYYSWDVNRWAGEPSELVERVLENLDPLIRREYCADAA